MPKAKPTQVIVHRIELQSKEREALEALVVGQTVKNVVVPAAVGAAVVSASYLSYKALKQAYDWGEDIVDTIPDLYEKYAPEGAKPSQDGSAQAVEDYLLFWLTGKGVLWGRKK